MSRTRIPAVYMRGGASKGVFFLGRDLPQTTAERDALLLRIVGSPDRYRSHADGMGGATQATSKVVIVSPSWRDECDVDYLFGAVSIDTPVIDGSGNCSDLAAAVGPFAIGEGLVPAVEGSTRVRIWQANTGRRIDAFVPVRDGQVLEAGDFIEDGVPFSFAEIRLEYLDPADGEPGAGGMLLPTGQRQEALELPSLGRVTVSMINAGAPTVFVRAQSLGLSGKEQPGDIDRERKLLERLELIRSHAAVRMGLVFSAADATRLSPTVPTICWVARPVSYRATTGVDVPADRIDLLARVLSNGRLHPAHSATGSIALAVAAALPGTVVSEVARTLPGVPTRIGQACGVLAVGADVSQRGGLWQVDKVVFSRSARRLMSGWVHAPSAGLRGPA